MKEVIKSTAVELEATNPSTGETFRIAGTAKESSRYYSISNITSRINAMDLLTTMANTCKSPKDINVLNQLLDTVDNSNIIRISNISKLAVDMEVSRSKLNALLKAFEEDHFFKKLDIGIYMVNPFIFIGKRVRSNELREAAQIHWTELVLEGD